MTSNSEAGEERLRTLIAKIEPVGDDLVEASEGRLEARARTRETVLPLRHIAARVSSIHQHEPPRLNRKLVLLCASDHGTGTGEDPLHDQWAGERVMAFLNSVAPVNNIARQVGARTRLLDVGVAGDIPSHPNLVPRKVAWGTAPMHRASAMGRHQASEVVLAGYDLFADYYHHRAVDAVAVGSVATGDGPSATLVAAGLLGLDEKALKGRKAIPVGEAGKRMRTALRERTIDAEDPLGLLTEVGGFEIGAMAGIFMAAARYRTAAVVDSFPSAVAALLARAFCPAVTGYLFASHTSDTPLHRAVLDELGLIPLLGFNMEGGEAVGATFSLGVMASCVAIWDQKAAP